MLIFSIYLISFYFFHSLLAANATKSFFSRMGLSPNYYRLFFNGFAGIFSLLGIYIYGNGDKNMILASNYLTKVVGLIIGIGGLGIVIIALKNYDLAEFAGTQQIKNQPTSKPDQLITKGMNKWVRHPLYLGTILSMLGVFLLSPNDMLLSLLVITIIYLFVGSYLEEQKLITQFGKDYIEYKKKVPMIFPRWW